MATPIAPTGPLPKGVGDEPPPALVHPGFYTGDDPIEWAKNRAAICRYNAAQLRSQKSDAARPLIEHNEREEKMFSTLLQKVK